MKPYFYRIGWGIVFVMINIRIGSFDILPDVVGYAMILSGLMGLQRWERAYAAGKWAASVLAILSIGRLFQTNDLQLFSNNLETSIIGMLFMLFETLLQMLLIYSICRGTGKLAEHRGMKEMASSAARSWTIYFVCSAATLVTIPFLLNTSASGLSVLLLLTMLGGLISMLLVILLVRQAGRELQEPLDISI
ncbi:hypothetical protein YSY43_11560 [Paenibacillus sp. YSY-4.3]